MNQEIVTMSHDALSALEKIEEIEFKNLKTKMVNYLCQRIFQTKNEVLNKIQSQDEPSKRQKRDEGIEWKKESNK